MYLNKCVQFKIKCSEGKKCTDFVTSAIDNAMVVNSLLCVTFVCRIMIYIVFANMT